MYYRVGEYTSFCTLLETALQNLDQRANPFMYKPSNERI
jgi:RNA polymerase-associated protein CTR9